MSSEESFTLPVLIAILILIIYTISSAVFEKFRFHYMHESGLCMIIGVLVTVIAMFVSPTSSFQKMLNFNDKLFFTFILPPIIFAAGYNLRKATFFRYFIYIFSFGVIGTIITFLIVLPCTLLANNLGWFHLINSPIAAVKENTSVHMQEVVMNYLEALNDTNETYSNDDIISQLTSNSTEENSTGVNAEGSAVISFSLAEMLLFASVISATDTIAALTFIKEDTEPKLFAILFGEGVLNDAVCIVLYRILYDFTSTGQQFTISTPLTMTGSFFSMFIFSFLIGAFVGCICSLLLKCLKSKGIYLNRIQEIAILLFFAFISYTLTEELGMSPIIALLFSGIFMSNYAFYNLSFQAREESSVVSKLLANIAEAFVFTYLGLTLLYYMTYSLSITFIVIEFFVVLIGRLVAIFGISLLMCLFKVKSFKMKVSEKGVMSCAGSIRGAIAFGLAISIKTPNQTNKEVLITSTLILVFFTTIVLGALMPLLIKLMKRLEKHSPLIAKLDPEPLEKVITFVHPNFLEEEGEEELAEDSTEMMSNTTLSYWLGRCWSELDDKYIKPRLIHDWPNVGKANKDIKRMISKTVNKYHSDQIEVIEAIDVDFKDSLSKKNEQLISLDIDYTTDVF